LKLNNDDKTANEAAKSRAAAAKAAEPEDPNAMAMMGGMPGAGGF
jgi:hypothetical protein